MTKYHVQWHKNLSLIPDDPVKLLKMNLSMLEGVKAELKSGEITEWGQYCDASGGYFILEGNETDIFNEILKWYPYISFDAKPVLSVDQVIESINKCLAEAKTK